MPPPPHSRIQFGIPNVWSLCLLNLFWIGTVSINTLRGSGQVFYRMSINSGLSDVLLTTRLGLQILGKKTTEMGCVSHHIPSGVHALMWLIASDINPNPLVQVSSARFTLYKITKPSVSFAILQSSQVSH